MQKSLLGFLLFTMITLAPSKTTNKDDLEKPLKGHGIGKKNDETIENVISELRSLKPILQSVDVIVDIIIGHSNTNINNGLDEVINRYDSFRDSVLELIATILEEVVDPLLTSVPDLQFTIEQYNKCADDAKRIVNSSNVDECVNASTLELIIYSEPILKEASTCFNVTITAAIEFIYEVAYETLKFFIDGLSLDEVEILLKKIENNLLTLLDNVDDCGTDDLIYVFNTGVPDKMSWTMYCLDNIENPEIIYT